MPIASTGPRRTRARPSGRCDGRCPLRHDGPEPLRRKGRLKPGGLPIRPSPSGGLRIQVWLNALSEGGAGRPAWRSRAARRLPAGLHFSDLGTMRVFRLAGCMSPPRQADNECGVGSGQPSSHGWQSSPYSSLPLPSLNAVPIPSNPKMTSMSPRFSLAASNNETSAITISVPSLTPFAFHSS